MKSQLSQRAMALADQRLALTDSKVTGDWSRPAVWCQPIHTVYILSLIHI